MYLEAQDSTAADSEDAVREEDQSTKAGDDFLHTLPSSD